MMSSSEMPRASRVDELSVTQPALWSLEDLSLGDAHVDVFGGLHPAAPTLEEQLAEAFASGREEGTALGTQLAMERLRPAFDALANALASIRANAESWEADAEHNLAGVATAIARQIIDREVSSDSSVVSSLVQHALKAFPLDHTVIVRLHPDDLALLNEARLPGATHEATDILHRVQWVADPRMVRGGGTCEGPDRIVDGRVDTALERIYRSLTDTEA